MDRSSLIAILIENISHHAQDGHIAETDAMIRLLESFPSDIQDEVNMACE